MQAERAQAQQAELVDAATAFEAIRQLRAEYTAEENHLRAQDNRLGAEIADAVANFLSGNMGEVGSADEDEENFNQIVDSGVCQHPAGRFVGSADIAKHPCLLRGNNFSASLSEVQLPREIQAVGSKEALEKLHQQIESSVADLHRKRKLPTTVEVQKQLRERGIEERAVQLLVLVCAQARHLFALWLTWDAVVLVLLAREPIQDFILQAEFSEEQYSQTFVEAFINKMNQRAGQELSAKSGKCSIPEFGLGLPDGASSRQSTECPLDASPDFSSRQSTKENVEKWDAPRRRRVRNPALRPLVVAEDTRGRRRAAGAARPTARP